MKNVLLSFLITTIAGLSTLLGIFTVFVDKKNRERLISCSLVFSAGIMIYISIFDLIPSGVKYIFSYYGVFTSILISLIFILFGFMFIKFLNSLLKEENSLYKVGIISVIALIIHNIPEGIITFMTTTKDVKIGLSLSFAIALHNIPEGISIFVPLYYGSGNKKKAFLYTFIAGFSELLGALLSYLFLFRFVNDYFFSFLFCVTAGIMIYIAFCELLPEGFKYKKWGTLLIWMFIGLFIMLLSEFIL